MKFSRTTAFFLSICLALIPATGWSSQPRPDQKTISNSQPDPSITKPFGVEFSDNFNWTTRETVLYGYSQGNGKIVDPGFCKSLKSPSCADNEIIRYFAVLPICTSVITLNCISNLVVTNKLENSSEKLEFVRYLGQPSETEYVSENEDFLPMGKSASLWRTSQAKGEVRYFLVSVVRVGAFQNKGGSLNPDLVIYEPSISGSITPVSFVTGDQFQSNKYEPDPSAQSIWPYRYSNTSTYSGVHCDFLGDGICLTETDFHIADRFSLDIHLSQKVNSWFHGRFASPEISIKESSTSVQISISADPVKVPVISNWVSRPTFTDAEKNQVGYNIDDFPALIYPSVSIGAFNVWSKHLPERSSFLDNQWSFYNAGANQFSGPPSCVTNQSGLVGVVSSNATLYEPNPPKFNTDSQTFDYSIAALHLDPDGSVFQGTYDLSISSQAARCIYKFSNAPVRASISVLAADGEISITTFTMNEKNGWIYISVRGLTFSNPTVRVKFSQEETVTEKPIPALVTTKPNIVRKMTLTCFKGKIVKKVTGLNPKCPSGFRKK